ncbi:hypothetical protein Cs7R123_12510 [Catellatospora sp. TT07R-123]|uniref:hypothetical protein n=1 Tax=Catellatospora sp. TT07R-123 TaxID=2733863 RepID=UPI001B1C5ED3|nr:hypothetical protein [Catellatospora sp. TT07R-123]GHJ43909.1 hypothetical protein Cs7R123_12510 [Catellatospora sp. TT07R-123]
MTTHDQLHELIHRAWDTKDGPARIVLAEQALAGAETLGDADLDYAANALATTAYHQGGEPMKAMVTFARCLSVYDADPGRRSQRDAHLLLWHFKFVVSALPLFPEMPLARAQAVLDDMQRRYQTAGHSLHAVYAYRHTVAWHLGDTTLADHWFRMWDAAPRDQLSDCAGCDPSSKAYYHAWRGRDEDAIAVAQPALDGRSTCAEQPHGILTSLLLPYVRTGRHDLARDAHRRAYRALSQNKADLGRIATHLEFCGLTGNQVRGLELVERHLPWLEQAPTPKTEMEFAASAALVLRRLVEDGQGGLPVRRPAGPVTVAELLPQLRERAEGLARRFDARNGNTFQSGRVAALMDAAPLVDYLPLSVTAAHTPAPDPAPADAVVDLSAAPADAPLDEQLDLVDEWSRQDRDAQAKALGQRIVAAYGPAGLTESQRGRLARLRAAHLGEDDLPGAAEALQEAVDAFVRAGDLAREWSARAQWSITMLRLTGDETHIRAAYEATEQVLAVSGDPEVRHGALGRAAWVAAMTGDHDRAQDLIARTEAEPGRVSLGRRVQLMQLHAAVLHHLGEGDRALARIREVVGLLRGTEHRDQLANALMGLARALGERGDNQATIAAFEEAAAVAQDPRLRREARTDAAFMLVTTDRAGEVIDDIVEHICLAEAAGHARPAAYTRHRLALALATTGRFGEAAEVGEEAVAWFVRHQDEEGTEILAELRDLLSRVYAELGEPHVAVGQIEALLPLVTGVEQLAYRAHLLARAGELLWQVDRDGEAAERFDAAAQAYGQADLALATVHARRRQAMALFHAGRPDEARAAAARLQELMAVTEVPQEQEAELTWERAMAGYEAAQILTNNEEPDYLAAVARVTTAAGLFRSIEAYGEALMCDLRQGQVLVVSGQSAAAEPVLRRVLEALPRDHGGRRDAAGWLSRALDEQGEARLARKLRKEYDLPEPE